MYNCITYLLSPLNLQVASPATESKGLPFISNWCCKKPGAMWVHSWKLTWKPKRGPIKTTVPLQWGYMGFHVSLGECSSRHFWYVSLRRIPSTPSYSRHILGIINSCYLVMQVFNGVIWVLAESSSLALLSTGNPKPVVP